MIQTIGLTKCFGSFVAVDAVDLDIPSGVVVGFLGPNGAGKSTTLRILSGFIPPSSGTATVAGFDVVKQSRRVRSSIGYLPESTPLYPEMRVVEYLRFRARLFGVARRDRSKAIDRVLRRCWLDDVQRKQVGHLSKGYRQRVGLAAAILHNPPVLLLDEPTSGLDPTQIREMRGLIRELAGEHTVFLSTHILSEVEMTCDRVVVIARGSIRAEGSIESLRSSATSDDIYIIETDLGNEHIFEPLREASEVTSEPIDGRWRRFRVISNDGTVDLREKLARSIANEGGLVREMRREAPTLEQMFIRVTSESEIPVRRSDPLGKSSS